VTYNPDILRDVLRARSLSRSTLSERLGIKLQDLESDLQRQPEPRQNILNDIARELALPPFVFFMKKVPPLHDSIADFRSGTPGPSPKSRATIESIQFATAIQKAAAELGAPRASDLPRLDTTQQQKNIEEFALRVRSFFNITLEDQAEAKDARAFYILCRKKIEDKGVFVLHDSFPDTDGSGFCLAHPSHPVIVINTKKQTRGRRLFTLIHELGHVLMGESGISDPFVRHNKTETVCNWFAVGFLVPESYVHSLLENVHLAFDPDPDDIARAARRLRISQQATVLRLEQMGLFKIGSHDKWQKLIHNLGNPDFTEKSGGGNGPPPQEKIKLAKYGFRFAAIFGPLLRRGLITELNLFRATGLKPKYQRAYFDYAKSVADSDLRALDLEDD
jgi:Zn-dependent peptidase ImmA (M78 family)